MFSLPVLSRPAGLVLGTTQLPIQWYRVSLRRVTRALLTNMCSYICIPTFNGMMFNYAYEHLNFTFNT